MITRSTLLSSLLLMALSGLISDCGGSTSGSTTTALTSSKLAQGPVSGAVVFADRVDGGVLLAKDADEVWTTTDASGNFKQPATPPYKYMLVSQGGTDTLTGLPAIQMLAQPGSANITILTTLLSLDLSNSVKLSVKLQALQPQKAALDFDVSTASTPAMLLLVKSVETAVQSITSAVKSRAGASGFTITDQQMTDIQFRALQQIALGFADTAENLATPAGLKTALAAAVASGIVEINKYNLNISFDTHAAAFIAENAVSAACIILKTSSSSTAALSVAAIQSEIDLAHADPVIFKAAFAEAISASNPTFAKVSSLVVTSASTPSPFGPPNIFIVFVNTIPGVITGSAGTGSTGGGTGGGFKPVL